MSTITTIICDVHKCQNKVNDFVQGKLQVVFTTEQTEGRSIAPYMTEAMLDVCDEHIGQMIKERKMLTGSGAQGHNTYTL